MSVMIGIDPHKRSHAAAAVDESEEVLSEFEVRASLRETRELLAWAEVFPSRRWAVESANGHGYLLAQQLETAGEHVVDVPPPRRLGCGCWARPSHRRTTQMMADRWQSWRCTNPGYGW